MGIVLRIYQSTPSWASAPSSLIPSKKSIALLAVGFFAGLAASKYLGGIVETLKSKVSASLEITSEFRQKHFIENEVSRKLSFDAFYTQKFIEAVTIYPKMKFIFHPVSGVRTEYNFVLTEQNKMLDKDALLCVVNLAFVDEGSNLRFTIQSSSEKALQIGNVPFFVWVIKYALDDKLRVDSHKDNKSCYDDFRTSYVKWLGGDKTTEKVEENTQK